MGGQREDSYSFVQRNRESGNCQVNLLLCVNDVQGANSKSERLECSRYFLATGFLSL